MARAKQTDRAEARRRYRAAQGPSLAPATEPLLDDEPEPAPPPSSSPFRLRMPDVRADLAALPGMFRSHRLLWIPVLLMLAAFVVAVALARGSLTDPNAGQWAALFVQFILAPPALAPIFIGGFVAPRASYLVGLLLGILNGVILAAVLLLTGTSDPAAAANLPATILSFMLVASFSGLAIGAFAAWYRDFLRSSALRRKQAQEARARAQRRDQRRGTRPA